MSTLRRALRYPIGVLIVLAIAYAAWTRVRPRSPASIREETFQAELTSMEDVLLVAGQVRPAVTIDLRAEASGIVEAVSVREGDRVSQGQELVRLDSKLAQSGVDQAEANLRQAELQDAAIRLDLDEETVALKEESDDPFAIIPGAGAARGDGSWFAGLACIRTSWKRPRHQRSRDDCVEKNGR